MTGHVYVELATSGSWQDAKQRAEATTYDGMKGHLVTITSQAELDLVGTLLQNNVATHTFWTAGNDLVSMVLSSRLPLLVPMRVMHYLAAASGRMEVEVAERT